MLEMAKRQGANAVINVAFSIRGQGQGTSEVDVHGTAIKIKPIVNYVPVGAVGTILAEMVEKEDP